ncbi:MAG: ExbD/TolR family protein [Planctomycetota bacterium]
MKIPHRPTGPGSLDGDTMTPMIDVVFLLLVFFICASVGGSADQLLPADLNGNMGPADAEMQPADPEKWNHPAIRVRVEPAPLGNFSVLLEDQPLDGIDELTRRLTQLASADPESSIILSIHDDIAVQQFISIYDLCQSLQFRNISFAVSGQ